MHRGQRVATGRQVVEAVHTLDGLGGVFGRQPDELLHLGVQRRRVAGQCGQATVGGHGAGAGMAQDVGHLVGLEHEIDRHQDRAPARQRKAQGRKAVGVARQHGDLVPFAHADAVQARGQA